MLAVWLGVDDVFTVYIRLQRIHLMTIRYDKMLR